MNLLYVIYVRNSFYGYMRIQIAGMEKHYVLNVMLKENINKKYGMNLKRETKMKKNKIKIKTADFIGTTHCISAEDGQKVFNKMESLLKSGKHVTVSFDGVSTLIPLFLNVAIGQLHGLFSEEDVRSMIQVEGLSGDDMLLLKRVVDNAKKYYANPKGYDEAWQAYLVI